MKLAKPAVGKLKQPFIAEQIAMIKATQDAKSGTPIITEFRTNMLKLQELRSHIDDLIWRYDTIRRELDEMLIAGRSIKL